MKKYGKSKKSPEILDDRIPRLDNRQLLHLLYGGGKSIPAKETIVCSFQKVFSYFFGHDIRSPVFTR